MGPLGELGALFNPGMRHELEERRAKEMRREEEGTGRKGGLRIDLESGVAVIQSRRSGTGRARGTEGDEATVNGGAADEDTADDEDADGPAADEAAPSDDEVQDPGAPDGDHAADGAVPGRPTAGRGGTSARDANAAGSSNRRAAGAAAPQGEDRRQPARRSTAAPAGKSHRRAVPAEPTPRPAPAPTGKARRAR